jgi:hypothetical protein
MLKMSKKFEQPGYHKFDEQQIIGEIALARNPNATSVRDIQPFLMSRRITGWWY